jgi:outer membrane lipoprotein SlyB
LNNYSYSYQKSLIKTRNMKKFILVFTAATVFVACGNKQEKTLGTETEATTAAPAPVVVKEVHYVNSAPAQQQPAQKKGWSKAAKGAVIGAGSGAVVGAVVSKKKGKGALIGAAAGAAGGYIIGRGKDKKDGRVQ